MKNYKEINNTKYVISRVFSGRKTTAMLIEERIRGLDFNNMSLEGELNPVYNTDSGSIQ